MEDRKRPGLLLDDAHGRHPRGRGKQLLRLATGRVGRRRQVDADRAAAARREADPPGPAGGDAPQRPDGALDLASITDGLRAEREQGITIDVAYRYFTTPRRSFIIADTPGHERYTRNMVTGASTAPARGDPDRRPPRDHRAVAPPRVPVRAARDPAHGRGRSTRWTWSTGTRAASARSSRSSAPWRAARRRGRARSPSRRSTATTSSSAAGRRLVRRAAAARAPGDGRHRLRPRAGPAAAARAVGDPPRGRRPGERRYAGQIAGGTLRTGDEVVCCPPARAPPSPPWRRTTGRSSPPPPPDSVTVQLAHDLDVGRGEIICGPDDPPAAAGSRRPSAGWPSRRCARASTYALKHTTRTVRAAVESIDALLDVMTLRDGRRPTSSSLNDIARITLRTAAPVSPTRTRRTARPARSS